VFNSIATCLGIEPDYHQARYCH